MGAAGSAVSGGGGWRRMRVLAVVAVARAAQGQPGPVARSQLRVPGAAARPSAQESW